VHSFERQSFVFPFLVMALVTSLAGQRSPDSSAAPRRIGNWIVAHNPPQDGGKETIVLALAASEGRRASGKVPLLMIRCESGKLDVFINWVDYLGLASGDVTMQLGSAPTERKTWKHATSNRVTFYPGNAKKFVRTLGGVDRFTAELTPYREPPVKAVFLVQGLVDALVSLKPACDID
jgi:hypothetical protein